MPQDAVESEFGDKAVQSGGLLFFTPVDAMRVIEWCKALHRRILGIDAFRVTKTTTQPIMAERIEYRDLTVDTWDKVMDFLSERLNSDLLYEVVCE